MDPGHIERHRRLYLSKYGYAKYHYWFIWHYKEGNKWKAKYFKSNLLKDIMNKKIKIKPEKKKIKNNVISH